MKNTIIFIFLFTINIYSQNQNEYFECTSGNCSDGYGTSLCWSSYKYVGYFKNGRFEGQGTYYRDLNSVWKKTYVGNWKNGKRNGTGTSYEWIDGFIEYKGTWRNGKQGVGVLYVGGKPAWKRIENGKTVFINKEGKQNKTALKEDSKCITGNCKSGYGIYMISSSYKYKGFFVHGKKNLQGIVYKNGIKVYEGWWKDDYLTEGTRYFPSGAKMYVGEFKNWKWSGKGILYYENGNKFYEGEFLNDKRQGIGTKYFKDGSKYVGQFNNNYIDGEGSMYYTNGDTFIGKMKKGSPNGYGKFILDDGGKIVGNWVGLDGYDMTCYDKYGNYHSKINIIDGRISLTTAEKRARSIKSKEEENLVLGALGIAAGAIIINAISTSSSSSSSNYSSSSNSSNSRAQECYSCGNSGWKKCIGCNGTGKKLAFLGIGRTNEACSSCGGRGTQRCKHY